MASGVGSCSLPFTEFAEGVFLVHTFLTQLLPDLEAVVTAVLLPALVIRLVRQVAHPDRCLQHTQVSPRLVVLQTQSRPTCSIRRKLLPLVYHILPSTTAITGYAIWFSENC